MLKQLLKVVTSLTQTCFVPHTRIIEKLFEVLPYKLPVLRAR
jgi:hypothetical protein